MSNKSVEADIVVDQVVGNLAVVHVVGRTLYGTGSSGSAAAMRYLQGLLNDIDLTASNELDVTFQWGEDSYDARNTLTTNLTTIKISN